MSGISIFWQKPLTNPFGKFRFFWVFKTSFVFFKGHSFFIQKTKTIFSGLICPKNTDDKKFDFWQKPWTNPFGKFRFFWVFKTSFVFFKGHSFFIQKTKTIFSGLICPKNTDDKKFDFWQKPWTNPFGKCRFFCLFLKLPFSGLKAFFFYPVYQKNDLFWLD